MKNIQLLFIALSVFAAFLLPLSCGSSGDKLIFDGDTDANFEQEGSDGDTNLDGDMDLPENELDPKDQVLLRLKSFIPTKRAVDLLLRFGGSYTIRYNSDGSEAMSSLDSGMISDKLIKEISDYLAASLQELDSEYLGEGVACPYGDLEYFGRRLHTLKWACSENTNLAAFLAYLQFWVDQNILQLPIADGDLDLESTDLIEEFEGELEEEIDIDWEAACIGPGEYSRIPLLDYSYINPGQLEYRLKVFEDNEYYLESTLGLAEQETKVGLLTDSQAGGIFDYITIRLGIVNACFDGQWCLDQIEGFVYLFDLPETTDGDSDSENELEGMGLKISEHDGTFIDYFCPQHVKMLEVISHLNNTINGLTQTIADGDEEFDTDFETEGELFELEEEAQINCDDQNSCTTDSYNEASEECEYTNIADETACDDLMTGTLDDECSEGKCIGINPYCPHWPLNPQGYCETNIMGNEHGNSPMIFVPKNSFKQGFEENECTILSCDDAKPAHTTVLMQGVWIDKYEVDAQSYYNFVKDSAYHQSQPLAIYDWSTSADNPCGSSYGTFTQAPLTWDKKNPVTDICWHAASSYCRWAGKKLLSESEWEYVARGPNGNDLGRKFPWGDADINCAYANFGDRNGDGANTDPCFNSVINTGSYDGTLQTFDAHGYFGHYDLSGNAAEWVYDAFGAYQFDTVNNPLLISGGLRVIRGGSYADVAPYLLSAYRTSAAPIAAYPTVGTRCAAPKYDADRDSIADQGFSICQVSEQYYCQDNCLNNYNPYQQDTNGNQVGDDCEGVTYDPVCGDAFIFEAESIASALLSLPEGNLQILSDQDASAGETIELAGYSLGDQLVLVFNLDDPFAGDLSVTFKKRSDSAMLRLFMDSPLGEALSTDAYGQEPINLYTGLTPQMLEVQVSDIDLHRGKHYLVLKVIDKHELSDSYKITVDKITLTPEASCE